MATRKSTPAEKARQRSQALRTLEALRKEIGPIVELYGNAANRSLTAAGKTAKEVLQILDNEFDKFIAVREDERYSVAEATLDRYLGAPRFTLTPKGVWEVLYGLLPLEDCEKMAGAIGEFGARFLASDIQWKIDGSIAAALQLSRSACMLTSMLEALDGTSYFRAP